MVLSGVSFELTVGENLAIVGPSGCGKSTLLHIVGTLAAPTSGRLTLRGVDPLSLDEPRLAAFRNHQIGFVFQEHYLLPQCSALENVLLPTLADGRALPEALKRARMLLDRVGLGSRLDHLPAELSGGERTAHGHRTRTRQSTGARASRRADWQSRPTHGCIGFAVAARIAGARADDAHRRDAQFGSGRQHAASHGVGGRQTAMTFRPVRSLASRV